MPGPRPRHPARLPRRRRSDAGSATARWGSPPPSESCATPRRWRTRTSTAAGCRSRAGTCSGWDRRAVATGSTSVTAYDRSHELIIDPGLEYSTLLGGTSHEIGAASPSTRAGNAYITGFTQSPELPDDGRRLRRTGAAGNYLRRLRHASSTRPERRWSTRRSSAAPTSIGARGSRSTRRATPTSPARRSRRTSRPRAARSTGRFNIGNCPRCGIDHYDAFVAKLNAAGSALVYSTFLGGTDIDDAPRHRGRRRGQRLRRPARRSRATSPRPPAPSTGRTNGGDDVFVTKLNAAGSALAYSTYLGGSRQRAAESGSPSTAAGTPTSAACTRLGRLPDHARRVRHDARTAALRRCSTSSSRS